MNGFMATFLSADRPRTAKIVRLGGRRIIITFAERMADRMDRRKVEHIETHSCDAGKPRIDVAECSMASGLRRGRSREQFIPRGAARFIAVHKHSQIPFEMACEPKIHEALHDVRQSVPNGIRTL